MAWLRGLAGSSANSIVPVSFSYGPIDPNGWPLATTARDAMVTLVTSARTTAGTSRAQSANVEIRRVRIIVIGVLQPLTTNQLFQSCRLEHGLGHDRVVILAAPGCHRGVQHLLDDGG